MTGSRAQGSVAEFLEKLRYLYLFRGIRLAAHGACARGSSTREGCERCDRGGDGSIANIAPFMMMCFFLPSSIFKIPLSRKIIPPAIAPKSKRRNVKIVR
jgi:hypothetical protein